MRYSLEERSPGRCGTGALENEADAIEFPANENSRDNVQPQAVPDLIALHIGEAYCARWAEGGEHD